MARLAVSPTVQISAADNTPLPVPETPPAPTVPVALIPNRMSASAHQRLLDCPYQYFVRDCLGLAPIPEPSKALEKADYGERVHRILRVFHSDVPDLPGPFGRSLTPLTLSAAHTLLRTISEAVFAEDVQGSFMARGWLYRWWHAIPAYLEWEMQRQRTWRPLATEVTLNTVVDETAPLILNGRIDRIDAGDIGVAILDYKTGRIPDQTTVAAGEQSQLPFYALLGAQEVEQALFIQLDRDRTRSDIGLEGEALGEMAERMKARLLHMTRAIRGGHPLPSRGNSAVCRHCEIEGLCRKPMWKDESRAA